MKLSIKVKKSLVLVSATLFVFAFQNCSKVSFSDANLQSGIQPPVMPPIDNPIVVIEPPVFVETHCGIASVQACAKGKGTLASPYELTSASCFLTIADSPSCHYKLMNDLDASSLSVLPIDNFSGVINGQGFSINNLVIKNSKQNTALFSSLRKVNGVSPIIRNLKITNALVENSVDVAIKNSGKDTAILAAYIGDDSIIDNLSLSGTILARSVAAGGVASVVRGNALLSNIEVNVSIAGSTRVGGIVGQLSENAKLSNASVAGVINANNRSGGAIGIIADNAEVLDVISEVNVASDAHKDGGFIGVQFSGNTKIIDSYSTVSKSILGCLIGGVSDINIVEKVLIYDKQTVNKNGCNGSDNSPSYSISIE